MAPAVQAVGTVYISPNNATTPMTVTGGTMPTHQAGDALLMFAFFDTGATTSSQTLSTPAGWTSLGVDADNLTHGMLFHVYFKIAASSGETFTSPSYAGGTTGTTGASGLAQVATIRPSVAYGPATTAADLLAGSSTATFITTAAQNITSVTGFTPTRNDTLVVVYGGKRDDWTGVATLTGDSLTYTEQGEPITTSGADAGLVWNTAPQTTAGVIASKTFTVTGGATEKSCGRMFALHEPTAVPLATAPVVFTGAGTVTVATAVPVDPAPVVFDVGGSLALTAPELLSTATAATVFDGTLVLTAPTPAFSPDSIAGLGLWLEADAIGGLSDGNTVTTWEDSSAANRDVTNSGGPTWQTNELNGLPVVRLDGTDDRFTAASSFTIKHVFVVAKFAATTFTSFPGLLTGTVSNAANVILVGGTAGVATFYDEPTQTTAYHKNGVSQAESAMSGPMNAFAVMSLSYSTGWAVTLQIGRDRAAASGRDWNGDIAEVIAYDTVLSSTDRQSVEAYLTDKYFPVAGANLPLATAPITTTASLALRAPTLIPTATAPITTTATMALTAPTRIPTATAPVIFTGSASLTVVAQVPTATAPVVFTGSLALGTPALLSLATAPTVFTGTLSLRVVTFVPTATAPVVISASMALTAPTQIPFAAAPITFTGSASLMTPRLLPLATASATFTASMTVVAITQIPFASASVVFTGTAVVVRPGVAILPFGAAAVTFTGVAQPSVIPQLVFAAGYIRFRGTFTLSTPPPPPVPIIHYGSHVVASHPFAPGQLVNIYALNEESMRYARQGDLPSAAPLGDATVDTQNRLTIRAERRSNVLLANEPGGDVKRRPSATYPTKQPIVHYMTIKMP